MDFIDLQKLYGTKYLDTIDCSKNPNVCAREHISGTPLMKAYGFNFIKDFILSYDKQTMQIFIEQNIPYHATKSQVHKIPYIEYVNNYVNDNQCTIIVASNRAENYENLRVASLAFYHDNFSAFLVQNRLFNKYASSPSKLLLYNNGKIALNQTLYSQFNSLTDLIKIINRQCNFNREITGFYKETYGINNNTIPYLDQIRKGNHIKSDDPSLNNISSQVHKHGLKSIPLLKERIKTMMYRHYLTDKTFNEMALKLNYLSYIENNTENNTI